VERREGRVGVVGAKSDERKLRYTDETKRSAMRSFRRSEVKMAIYGRRVSGEVKFSSLMAVELHGVGCGVKRRCMDSSMSCGAMWRTSIDETKRSGGNEEVFNVMWDDAT
jgi:hypothetical protein